MKLRAVGGERGGRVVMGGRGFCQGGLDGGGGGEWRHGEGHSSPPMVWRGHGHGPDTRATHTCTHTNSHDTPAHSVNWHSVAPSP